MKMFGKNQFFVGYGLLLFLSFILRFNQLQAPMLSDHEATIALRAVGQNTTVAGSSGLVPMLKALFFLIGQNEIAARVIPALMGLLLVLAPFLFRRFLGNKTSVILSVLLMFDPGLIAYSRQLDGAIISVCGLLFSGGFLVQKRFIPAGIFASIALLGSPILWPGILSIGLAFWLAFIRKSTDKRVMEETDIPVKIEKAGLNEFVSSLVISVLLLGSLFGTHLMGVASPIINLLDYIRGWGGTNELSPFLVLFSLVLYYPLIFILSQLQLLNSRHSISRIDGFLNRWFLFSLVLAVIYPNRGMDSMLLTIIPLLVLSARFINILIDNLEKPDIPAIGQMLLIVLLVAFGWMNLIALKFPVGDQESTLRLAAAGGALLLLVISTILIRLGWPPQQSTTGIWMGLAVLALVFGFSTAWRAAGLGIHPEAELWNYAGITDESDLLLKTAGDLSEWTVGNREGINVVLLQNSSPALKWALRSFTSVQDVTSLPVLSNPAIIITNSEESPALPDSYRGQDFVVIKRTAWSIILPEEWIKWYAFRELPGEKIQSILWARTDLFPGSANTAPATITPIQ